MPVNSYAAKIFVKDKENGTTEVLYKAGFFTEVLWETTLQKSLMMKIQKKVSDFYYKFVKRVKSNC